MKIFAFLTPKALSRRSWLRGTAPLDFPTPLILFTASSVLFGPPTAHTPFTPLPFWLLGIPSLHTWNGAYRLSPVDAPLFVLHEWFSPTPPGICFLCRNVSIYVDFRSGNSVIPWHYGLSMLYSHPYSHAVYASQYTLPHTTQNSLPMPRLTAYRVGVSCPLCETPLAGRTT